MAVSRSLLASGLAALVFPACALGAACRPAPLGPDGLAFYTPPATLPSGSHGTLIWQRPYINGSASMAGGTNTLLLYTQEGVTGATVATSGYVVVPAGEAPADGWPVVTFAHGTTGIADVCAPTRNDPATDTETKRVLLESWISKGYAVVRTDYEGLGTPGDHPYLIGASEGKAVLDAVRAARQLDARIGARVVVAGHSQGGHAALWAASLAPAYTPELTVLGTIAFAPANSVEAEVSLIRSGSAGNTTALSATVAFIVRGLGAANATLAAAVDAELWTPAARALYPQTRTACSAALNSADSFGGLGASDLLSPTAPDSLIDDIAAQITANDPTFLSIAQPVLVLQGSADTTVLPATTLYMVGRLLLNGVSIVEKIYDGATHQTVIDEGADDATTYLDSLFAQ